MSALTVTFPSASEFFQSLKIKSFDAMLTLLDTLRISTESIPKDAFDRLKFEPTYAQREYISWKMTGILKSIISTNVYEELYGYGVPKEILEENSLSLRITKALESFHPIISTLINEEILSDDCFIAGGALIEANIAAGFLTPKEFNRPKFDIDIFLTYGQEEKIGVILEKLKPYEPKAFIKSNIITICTKNLPNIQITRTMNINPYSILNDFDLYCCQVGFGDKIMTTERFMKVFDRNWTENTGKPLALERRKKYEGRGITINAVFSFESKSLYEQKYIEWEENDVSLLEKYKECGYEPFIKKLPPLEIDWMDQYNRPKGFRKSKNTEDWNTECTNEDDNKFNPCQILKIPSSQGLEEIVNVAMFQNHEMEYLKDETGDLLFKKLQKLVDRYIEETGFNGEIEIPEFCTYGKNFDKELLNKQGKYKALLFPKMTIINNQLCATYIVIDHKEY